MSEVILEREAPGIDGMQSLGRALGAGGAALGCTSVPRAAALLRAAADGVAAAGGLCMYHNLSCPVQGAWAGRRAGLDVSLFLEAEGTRLRLYCFDWLGRLGGEIAETSRKPPGESEEKDGTRLTAATWENWAAETAARASLGRPLLRRVRAAVGQDSPGDRALRAALSAMGCRLEERWRPGIPAFSAGRGGLRLTAQDEKGALLDPGQLLALVTLIEMENGGGRVAVPPGATAAVDLVAAGYSGTVLRLDRDGAEARELYASLPWLWSAPDAAARICARMAVSGQRLEALMAKTPRFSAWEREVPLSQNGERVLRILAREGRCTREGAGLRLRTGDGWVHLVPLARRSALRVVAEGPDLELAAELCDFFARRAEQADQRVEN